MTPDEEIVLIQARVDKIREMLGDLELSVAAAVVCNATFTVMYSICLDQGEPQSRVKEVIDGLYEVFQSHNPYERVN